MTPLVLLDLYPRLGKERLPVIRAFKGENGLGLRNYEEETLVAELLTLPFVPASKEGETVNAAVLLVWRLRALEDTLSIALIAEREPDAFLFDSSPRTSILSTTATWRAQDARVSIGTPDSESLAIEAGDEGTLPARIAPAFEGNSPKGPYRIGYQGGMGIGLPALLKGESVQVHLVVAWATGRIERRDYGTIEAVGLLDPTTLLASRGVV